MAAGPTAPSPRDAGAGVWGFRVGWEWIRLGDAVPGEPPTAHRAPVSAALVKARDGTLVLFDCGISDVALRTPERVEHLYLRPCEEEGGGVAGALARLGVELEEIAHVLVSHLHLDHTGCLPRLGGASAHVGAAELDWGRRTGLGEAVSPQDLAGRAWQTLDGAAELAPGVTAIPTPGHTPGHRSLVVDLPGGGGVVLAGDALERLEDLDRELPTAPASYDGSADDVRRSAGTLRALARTHELVPCHCPRTWRAAARVWA